MLRPRSAISLASFSVLVSLAAAPAASAGTVHVSNAAQLTTALANAGLGDEVVVAAGTYAGPFTVTLGAGFDVRGVGKVVLTAPSGAALGLVGCETMKLENLEFESDGMWALEISTCYGIDVRDCRATAGGFGAFHVTSSRAVTIDRCRIEGLKYGVIASGQGILIRDTEVIDPVVDGIRLEDASD